MVAALEPLVLDPRRERLRAMVAARIGTVTALLDDPQDPHNGAAVLRSADAFGVKEIHVVERRAPFLVAPRVAQGSERWVSLVRHADGGSAAAHLRARGFHLVATHPAGEWTPEALADVPRVALLFGNEHRGLGEDLRSAADSTVRVPMRGMVESLNLSVSAALLLRAATARRAGDLDEEEQVHAYARGLFQSVPRAAEVLRALG